MNYTKEIDPINNLVTVTYAPDMSYQDRINLLDELIVICKSYTYINILIDTRHAKKELTIKEQKELGELIASKEQLLKRNKTVIVNSNSYLNRFITPFADASGFKRICQFDGKNDAINWLNGSIK